MVFRGDMNSNVIPSRLSFSHLVFASALIVAACSTTPKEVGIDLRFIVAPSVDMTKTTVLQFYLNELTSDPALFESGSTEWTTGIQGNVAFKTRYNDIDNDYKYEFVFRVEQNVFTTSNAFTFSMSGRPLARPFRIVGAVFDAQGNLLAIGESADTNFSSSLQTVSIQMCPNNQCPQSFFVGESDAGADAGIVTRDIVFAVGSSVDRSLIASVDFFFDEPAGYPSLSPSAMTTPVYGISNGVLYSYTIEDVDSDGKYEIWVKVPSNLFASSSTMAFPLSGPASPYPFHVGANVRNSASVLLGSGYSEPVYMVGGADAAVVNICLASESCRWTLDAGTDTGADAGIDAGIDAGTLTDGGSDGG